MSNNRPVVDFSEITWFEPYALIYLGMFLRHYNRSGKFFKVIYPAKQQACDYLTSQNFWDRFNFTPNPANDQRLLRLASDTSFRDVIDLENKNDQAEDVGNRLTEILQKNAVRVSISSVIEAVTEIVQNFVEHADEGFGAMVAQFYPNKHKLHVAVGDCGMGIKASLLQSDRNSQIIGMTHKEAIAEAFKPCVTSKIEGGMGFDFVKDIVYKQTGELFLSSNDGCVYIDIHGKLYYMDVPYNLPGVQVEICFPERL